MRKELITQTLVMVINLVSEIRPKGTIQTRPMAIREFHRVFRGIAGRVVGVEALHAADRPPPLS